MLVKMRELFCAGCLKMMRHMLCHYRKRDSNLYEERWTCTKCGAYK